MTKELTLFSIRNNSNFNILDPILGSFFNENLECLGMDSRWVIYGAMGGIKVQNANMLKLMNKRASIHTTTLRNQNNEYKKGLI